MTYAQTSIATDVNRTAGWERKAYLLEAKAGDIHLPKSKAAAKCLNCSAHKSAFCAGLAGAELEAVSAIGSSRRYAAGQTLFNEHDDCTHYYTVTSGYVRLSRLLPDGKRQITGFRRAGDFLGYEQNGLYTTDAEAVGETTVCRQPKGAFDALLMRSDKMQRQLLNMMKNRLIEAEAHNVLLGRKTPVSKLCSFLEDMMKDRAGKTADMKIDLPMSRHDIADYLGLTIETVSRTFTKLRLQEIIDLPDNHSVRISDEEMLHDLAEGF